MQHQTAIWHIDASNAAQEIKIINKKIGYPASYKEMVQNINTKKDTISKQKEKIPIKTNNYINQNVKFAELFKEVTAKKPTITNTNIEKIL